MAAHPNVDAMNRLLLNTDNDVTLVMALIDRVQQDLEFFEGVIPFAEALLERYMTLGPNFQAREIEINRLHPFVSRLFKDLHQILHPQGGHRAHLDNNGTLSLGRLLVAKEVLVDAITLANIKAPSASSYLYERVRQGYVQTAQEQGLQEENVFMNEVFRFDNEGAPVEKEACSNLFFTDVLLRPPSIFCPFCDERMQLSHTIPDPVLLITGKGYKYGRHYEVCCKRPACPRRSCSRHYDSITYKDPEQPHILVSQLERPGIHVSLIHENQRRHENQKYFQIGARIFFERDFAKEISIAVYRTSASVYPQASAFLDLYDLSLPPVANMVCDDEFQRIVESSKDHERVRKWFWTAIAMFHLQEQWAKRSYGHPIYVKLPTDVLENVNIFPPINQGPAQNVFTRPLQHFQHVFGGKRYMGSIVERRSTAEDPRRVDFGLSVEGAIESYMDIFVDTQREEGFHECDKCVQIHPVTERVVSGGNYDGVFMPIASCNFGQHEHDACTEHLTNNFDRYCTIHDHLKHICGIIGCQGNVVNDTFACVDHQGEFFRWQTSSKGGVRWRTYSFLRQQGKMGRPRINQLLDGAGIRQALSAFLTHDPEWLLGFQNGTRDLDQYVGVIDSYLEDHVNHVLNISHEFSRLFSKCEGYMVKSCGHVVNRRHAFRSESLDFVLTHLLIATDGGRSNVPTFLYYDRACALTYYLAGILHHHPEKVLETRRGRQFVLEDFQRLFDAILPVMDPFHYNRHHHLPYLVDICNFFCNPNTANNPAIGELFVNGQNGERLFNCEIQETTSGIFGRFEKAVHSMTRLHGEFLLEMMVSIRNETLFKQLLREQENPRYLHPDQVPETPPNPNFHMGPLEQQLNAANVVNNINQQMQQEAENIFNVDHPAHNQHSENRLNVPINLQAPAAQQFYFG